VSVTESRHCHYTYSNVGKVVEDLSKNAAQLAAVTQQVQAILCEYIPDARLWDGQPYYVIQTDVTKVIKPHSKTLEGRQYVPVSNNRVPGNKPIDAGCRISITHVHAESGWSLPLETKILDVEDDAIAMAVAQVKSLLDNKSRPFGQHLCIEEADSSYGQAAFLSPLYEYENLVCIVRLKSGCRVWLHAEPKSTNGAPSIYGEKYYLNEHTHMKTYKQKPNTKHTKGLDIQVMQRSVTELEPQQSVEQEQVLKNGRKVNLYIKRWNNVMIRSKNGHNMKDKPFDLIRVEIRDVSTLKLVFDRPMFIAVSGKRKNEASTIFAQQRYRERFDVEPTYNFIKHDLLLQNFQTSIRQHLSNYLIIVTMTLWLLFVARNETSFKCKPWQKYLPKNKQAALEQQPTLSMAQTRNSIATLFDTFDPTPFRPLYYKKGMGRPLNTILQKRQPQPFLKKSKKQPKINLRV